MDSSGPRESDSRHTATAWVCQTCARNEHGNRRGVGLIPRGPRPSRGKVLEPSASRRCTQTWAMLIKQVYEIDPLICPRCSGQMKVVAFIEPPQGDMIEKILRHCGLWRPASPRAPLAGDLRVHDPDGNWVSDSASREPWELTFVDEAAFWATF